MRLSKTGSKTRGALKYTNKYYNCPVVTSQEQFILFNNLERIQTYGENIFEVVYSTEPQAWDFENTSVSLSKNKTKTRISPSQLSMLKAQ